MEQACKCMSLNIGWDCQFNGANALSTTADYRGETDTANANMNCCLISKYDDLLNMRRYGLCYDTTQPIQCCDDGNIYDPGTEQCCPINGVQSLNLPCPCSFDSDCCANGATCTEKKCCRQDWPAPYPEGQGPMRGHCSKYSNWPDGQAPAEVQRCVGNCYSTAFQTCCNGQICRRDFERCCNSTCCNRFTSSCTEGQRAGSLGFGSRVNPNDYLLPYESCTQIETMTTRRAFWVFVMPVFWTFAALLSLAVVLVVARRATENVFELTERAMTFFAAIMIFLGIPFFFSPLYKYGVVIVFVALFAIVAAVMRSKFLSLSIVVLLVVLLLYWVDPFEGNIWLSFTGGLSPTVTNDRNFASGIVEALARLDRTREECTGFYDFFMHDPYIHDFARFRNPNRMTFGYCTRAWMTALLIFACIDLVALLVLLMLAIFSLTKKLMPKAATDDLTFEVRPVVEHGEPEVYQGAYDAAPMAYMPQY
eukprot:NODE_16_length_2791_cov_484.680890_g13_i0.p1 GENE.NODE_16_length_2791_cov_484.680890_g13_i0~~NODE_16_length_2791_cov_484.680890_g13_i0.p1  ORF type:complete len:479 (-),score=242.61 NODE_16_length_2791_cov_484.680890_g13_i0:229-1665(-)